MPLGHGTSLGVYEIAGLLGAGGMGEVYRARDTKLRREVALKVLPEAFAADPERRARFTREAQMLATLNHPHIAAIYGVEESAGVTALVLELVDGPTLAERIDGLKTKGSGLPVAEALTIAAQIADALDAAHEKGIVHRDLKPANIKLTADDRVKVLDFGLAKALADDARPDASMSPTMTAMASRLGVIVGTAAYMSPEQAKGKVVDKRTDIWAFGCVLYEMLTGVRAFAGDDVTDFIVSVMTKEPDWAALPATTPPRVVELLHRCLKKDPRERLRDIGDARLELLALSSSIDDDGAQPRRATGRWRERLAWGLAAVSIVALAAGALYATRNTRSSGLTRFAIPMTSNSRLVEAYNPSVAISPDGTTVAFVAADASGNDLLWIRRLDKLDATPLLGTDGAYFPFWSPDSQTIAFFAHRKLKKIPAAGGPAQTLCDAPRAFGGSWGSRGDIVFNPDARKPLYRVSALGGDSTPVTSLDAVRQDRWHLFPSFLPDGEHFVFENTASPETTGIYMGSLKSKETKRVLKGAEASAVFAPNGFLLFVRGGALQAQKFDLSSQELVGTAYPVGDASPGFSTSATGVLAYRMGAANRTTQLAWFDRSGARGATVGAPGGNAMPTLSPDGATVAVSLDGDIWLLDARSGSGTKFTTDAKGNGTPVWSPDGRSILYISDREGFPKIYQKLPNGAGQEQLVDGTPALQKLPFVWSTDGKYVSMFQASATGEDLFVLPMLGDHRPQVYLQTKFSEYENRLSPDGKWMVYVSEDSDRPEVYVQPFPRSDERWKISVAGGVQPMWRRDGEELFYLALNATLMAVDVKTTPRFEQSVPHPLFGVRAPLLYTGWSYAPTRDGQRFLVSTFVDDAPAIGVVLNWPAAIPR